MLEGGNEGLQGYLELDEKETSVNSSHGKSDNFVRNPIIGTVSIVLVFKYLGRDGRANPQFPVLIV